jgi:1-piperideine-2-carboxylate/1-pyrroline-2-carboxylate reductase [NAD(P)H]
VKVLNAEETSNVLPFQHLTSSIATAARELAAGDLNAPERMVLQIDNASSLLCMPAVSADIGIAKLITVHARNSDNGRSAIQGELVVFNAATGERLLLLDGPVVTARRTAAVTLLGISILAAKPPQSALLIGTGAQAFTHAEALIDYFNVQELVVAGIDISHARKFSDSLRYHHPRVGVTAISVDKLDAKGAGTDVVIALTTATQPVVPAELPDDTLAIGVGAFRPDMAELPPDLLQKRQIVVDYRAGAEKEAGDLLQANVRWSDVLELSELLDDPNCSAAGPYVFKSVGHASWDLAAARVAMATLHGRADGPRGRTASLSARLAEG